MVHIYVEEESLVVELGKLEKILALKSRLVIPLSCIEDVRPVRELSRDEKEHLLPRIKLGGVKLGSVIYGTFSTSIGRGFFATKDLERSVAIYTRGCTPYSVVVVEISDPMTLEAVEKALKMQQLKGYTNPRF